MVAFLNETIEFGVVEKQEFLDKEAISGTKMPIPQPPTISHEIDEKLSLLFKNFEDKIFKVEKKVDKVGEILVLKDERIDKKLNGLYDFFPAKRDISRDVFIVHGHDELIKQTVARFLERIELKPIILYEQPSAGNTIIEKLERYSDVNFGIVLLTPDDEGYPKGKPKDNKCRARQNVIMELGFLMGRLGRDRVVCLHKPEVELPSDILGIVFIPFNDSDSWKMQLVKDLRHAGIEFNSDKVF